MNGNKTTATSSEERRMQRGISVLAFFVPAFIMLVLFIIRGIYPFGDRSFLFSDMYHQYMPFLSEFVHKIKAGEGLFYSYNVGSDRISWHCMSIIWQVLLTGWYFCCRKA